METRNGLEVDRLLQIAASGGDRVALRNAFTRVKGDLHDQRRELEKDPIQFAGAPDEGLPCSLYVRCCEVSISLGEWDIAQSCVECFRERPKTSRSLQSRALFCEGLVRSHNVSDLQERRRALEERLVCASVVLDGVTIAVEDWPRTAEVVVDGIDNLWLILSIPFRQGFYQDLIDTVAFVLSLHERLMIGGGYTHLLWTQRYATCLRGVGRVQEAITQLASAVDTAVKLQDERLIVQGQRALTAALADRETPPPGKSGKSEALPASRTNVGYAVHVTQLFLAGYYGTNSRNPNSGGLPQACLDLTGAFDRLEGVAPTTSQPAPTAGKSNADGAARPSRGTKQHSSQTAAGAPTTAAGSASGNAALQSAAGAASVDREPTDPTIVEEVLSDVVLCLALSGTTATQYDSCVTRLLRSANSRVRCFAMYARALLTNSIDAIALNTFASAPDTSSLPADSRKRLLTCIHDLEDAMAICNSISNDAEKVYAIQTGCALVWAVVQPLLREGGETALRHSLNRLAENLQRIGTSLPGLLVAVEYESGMTELHLDNLPLAQRRVAAALQREQTQCPPKLTEDGLTLSSSPGSDQKTAVNDAQDGTEDRRPSDFPLLWLQKRVQVRRAVDAAVLTTPTEHVLRLIEQAAATSSQTRRLPLLHAAFTKLPPLTAPRGEPRNAPSEVDKTSRPNEGRKEKDSSVSVSKRGSGRSSSTSKAERKKSTLGGIAPVEALSIPLPDRELLELYYSFMKACQNEKPLPPPLVVVARAVATALYALPSVPLTEENTDTAPMSLGPSLVDFTRMQAEAALFLCELGHATENSKDADACEAAAGKAKDFRKECVQKAAELGALLAAHGECGEYLCANACQVFLTSNADVFSSGDFGNRVSCTLEKLYTLLDRLPHRNERTRALSLNLGLCLVLALLHDYVTAKGEVNEELHAGSYEGYVYRLLRYPKGEANNALLKRAMQVAVDTLHDTSFTAAKAHLCMLLANIGRLVGTANAAGGWQASASRPELGLQSAQEQLLYLAGYLVSSDLSKDEKINLLRGDAMRLLSEGPPTVRLCGLMAAVASEAGDEVSLLQLSGMATALYSDGKLGWCSYEGGRVATTEGTAGKLGTAAPSTTPSAATPEAASGAPRVVEVQKPISEDWMWFAFLLYEEASVRYRHCATMDAASATRLALKTLTLCTNSVIASTRVALASRRDLCVNALRLYCQVADFAWRKGCERSHLLPSLHLLLQKTILEPVFCTDGSARTGDAAIAEKDEGRSVVQGLVHSLCVRLVRCYTYLCGAATDAAAGDRLADEETKSLRYARQLLTAKQQRELFSLELALVGRHSVAVSAFTKALKGKDSETAALAWTCRAQAADTQDAAAECWDRVLAVCEGTPNTSLQILLKAQYYVGMTLQLCECGWSSSYVSCVEGFVKAIQLLEGSPGADLNRSLSKHSGQSPARTDADGTAVDDDASSAWIPLHGPMGLPCSVRAAALLDRSLLFFSLGKDVVADGDPELHGKHARILSDVRSRGGDSAAMPVSHIALALTAAATLWSLSPVSGAVCRTTAADSQALTKKELAILVVHYVECLWRVCVALVSEEEARKRRRSSAAPSAQTAPGESVQLPASAEDWLGFSFPEAFVSAVAHLRVLDDVRDWNALLCTVFNVAKYLSDVVGCESYVFVLLSWLDLMAQVSAQHSDGNSTEAESLHRATYLLATVTAARCGCSESVLDVYRVEEASPHYWRGIAEHLRVDAQKQEAVATQSADLGENGEPRMSSPPPVITVDAFRGSLHTLLAEQALMLCRLGRADEASTLVDLVRPYAADVNDRDALSLCELHATELLLTARKRPEAARVRVESTMSSSAFGALSLAVRVRWAGMRIRTLAAVGNWTGIAGIVSCTTGSPRTSDGSIISAPATSLSAFLTAQDRMEIRRVTVAAALQCVVSAHEAYAAAEDREDDAVRRALLHTCVREILRPELCAPLSLCVSAVLAAKTVRFSEDTLDVDFSTDGTGRTDVGRIRKALEKRKEEAHHIDALLKAVREERLRHPVSKDEVVPSLSPSLLSLTQMEAILLLTQSRCTVERVLFGESVRELYRQLSLAELQVPKGDGPAHLEPVVAAFMRDPTALPQGVAGSGSSCASATSGSQQLAAATVAPPVGMCAETLNAFAHYDLPVELLDGLNRDDASSALRTAKDLLGTVPASALAHYVWDGVVESELLCALEVRGVQTAEQRGEWLRSQWAAAPLGRQEKTAGHTGSAAGRKANKKETGDGGSIHNGRHSPLPGGTLSPAAAASTTTFNGANATVLQAAVDAAEDALFCFDFDRLRGTLSCTAHLLALWGQHTRAAAAAEMLVAASLARETVLIFDRGVEDTSEGALWREFRAMVAPFSAGGQGLLGRCGAARVFRDKLLGASSMLQRLEKLPMQSLVVTDGSDSLAPAPLRPSPPKSGAPAAAPRSRSERPRTRDSCRSASELVTVSFPSLLALPDGVACLSVAQVPHLPLVDMLRDTTHVHFLVVFHHPDGATDSRMVIVRTAALRELYRGFQTLLARREDDLLLLERTQPTERQGTSRGGGLHVTKDSVEFFEDLREYLTRLDSDLTAPLLSDFDALLVAHASKQPLHLCLDPILQPLPLEHGTLLSRCTAGLTRQLSVFAVYLHLVGAFGSSTPKAPAGAGALIIVDPSGDRETNAADAILGAEATKQRSTASSTAVLSSGGAGLRVSNAAIACALQSPSVSSVLFVTCGSLRGGVPLGTFCSVQWDRVNAVMLAAGAVSQTSTKRETRHFENGKRRLQELDSYTWQLPILMIARGVRSLSTLSYPGSIAEVDDMCRRSLPSLSSGKGFADVGVGAPLSSSMGSMSKVSTATKVSVSISFGAKSANNIKHK